MSSNSYQFTGVFIPASIFCDKYLGAIDKLVWAEINALSQSRPCTATNEHFAKHLGVEERSIQRIIKNLIEKGYLFCQIIKGHIRNLFAIQPQNEAFKNIDKGDDKNVTPPMTKMSPHVNTKEERTKETSIKGSNLKERYPKEKKSTPKPKPKKEIPQDPLSLLENDPFLSEKMLSPSAKEMKRGEQDNKLFGLTLEKVMSKIKDFFPDTEKFQKLRAKFNDLTLYYMALDMEKYDNCRPIRDKMAYLEKLLLDKILNTRNKFRNSYV